MSNPLEIIFESNQLIVVRKPAGMITEDNPFEADNLEAQVYKHLKNKQNNPYLGIAHRLDKVTSGVVIMAKKPGTLKTLNAWFENRKIKKTYLAISGNAPFKPKGTLSAYLLADRKEKRAQVVTKHTKGAKWAQLRYDVMNSKDAGTLFKIHPLSGRFHQIRTQLSHLGCPILGDVKYGSTSSYVPNEIALHAYKLQLPEPIGDSPISFTAAPPQTPQWHMLFEDLNS